ncbi:uncharacterized protein NPIL_147971 [Nephila pilipes]|uniref:Ferredoxin n=1 Tax=Nephila pilipes TaxID=299642 RepID=A0A8X6IIN6_NEPPI|nr:uncharacterized protein NPIL_147971 [Nephila pilipes]
MQITLLFGLHEVHFVSEISDACISTTPVLNKFLNSKMFSSTILCTNVRLYQRVLKCFSSHRSIYFNIHDKKIVNEENMIKIIFIKPSGEKYELKGNEGWCLVELVQNNNLKEEFQDYGFCYASNWCRTCHVYFKPEDYNKLPVVSSEELYHIKRDPGQIIGSSRLGCQIRLAKNMEGMEVRLPIRFTTMESDLESLPDQDMSSNSSSSCASTPTQPENFHSTCQRKKTH